MLVHKYAQITKMSPKIACVWGLFFHELMHQIEIVLHILHYLTFSLVEIGIIRQKYYFCI